MVYFKDYPEFSPNLTPRQVILEGSFGGTYFRPIYSAVLKKKLQNVYEDYSFFDDIPLNLLTTPWRSYDKNINKYKVKVGTTLEFWESKDWIEEEHPYGWFQWYCDFYDGKRSDDDERQISRWLRTAGPNSRFRKRLIKMIKLEDSTFDDFSISPKIRQTLQHWGVRLTAADMRI